MNEFVDLASDEETIPEMQPTSSQSGGQRNHADQKAGEGAQNLAGNDNAHPTSSGRRPVQNIPLGLVRQMGWSIAEQICPGVSQNLPKQVDDVHPHLQKNHSSQPSEYRELFLKLLKKPQPEIRSEESYRKFMALPVDQQVYHLSYVHTLTYDDLSNCWRIVTNIVDHLKKYYPNCKVYGLGSLITGFKHYSPAPSLTVCLDGLGENEKDKLKVLQIITEKIQNHPEMGSSVKVVGPTSNEDDARIQLLLEEDNDSLSCDIFVNSDYPLHKISRLIRYSMDRGNKFRGFMALILYWAKAYQVLGVGQNNFTQYELHLLALVYLQKMREIIFDIDKEKNDICYEPIINRPSCEVLNYEFYHSSQFIVMMTGFCKMYENVQFSNVIVSPYVGDLIPKKWNSQKSLPIFSTYQYNTLKDIWPHLILYDGAGMWIQDPFLLHNNISFGKSIDAVTNFKNACRTSGRILSRKGKEFNLLDLFMTTKDSPGPSRGSEDGGNERVPETREVSPDVILIDEDVQSDDVSSQLGTPECGEITEVQLNLDADFAKQYMDKLKGNQFLQALCCDSKKTLFPLWQQFSFEFIHEVFEYGVQLNVTSQISVRGSGRGDSQNSEHYKSNRKIHVSYPFWRGVDAMASSNATDGSGEWQNKKNPVAGLGECFKKVMDEFKRSDRPEAQNGTSFVPRKRSKLDPFTEFDIGMSLNLRKSKDDIPQMKILLNNSVVQNEANKEYHQLATQAISQVLQTTFQPFLIYKLNTVSFS